MNRQKVFVGGLVAGIILIVLDYISGSHILGPYGTGHAEAMNAAVTATMNSKRAMYGGVATDLVLGWSVAWLYAAIRPRMGAGARTAMCAGFFVWLVFALAMGSYYLYRLASIEFMCLAAIVMLVELLIASYVAGMMYAEEGAAK
ncbi:MAG: hypothetical protein KGL38_03230 [Gemmatimonadota bacterium]|nr:hypothetical protein [Gemmatimonadota bacterium]MDE3173022.1 hypothetical protein [Gemmatimonadota bacterium]